MIGQGTLRSGFPVTHWAAAVLDLLLPPMCLTCDSPVDAPGLQCGACFRGHALLGDPCCACCGTPFELSWHAAEAGLCQRCADWPPPFERARAALSYGPAARRLILPFKHGDRTEYGRVLVRLMAGAGRDLLRDADVLIPVPLHRRRLFARRYNQAALLARGLGRASGRDVLLDGLVRHAATGSLGGKSALERKDEVSGAFAVSPARLAAIAGRRVLVIDDVMTSGATVSACALTLLEAGAVAVDVLVAALVPPPRAKTRRRRQRARSPSHP